MAFFKKIGEKFRNLFSSNKIDDEFFDNLEDTLIEADLGSRLTMEVVDTLRAEARSEKISDPSVLHIRMKELLSQYIRSADFNIPEDSLSVFMVLGVNGVGKTTTIAKMSKYYAKKGQKVLLAAADTFRAAAVDQLEIHADRLGMRIVKQQMGSDPGAVIFDAITSAQSHGDSLIIADTAGRMHNKENLMKELKKMDKIIKAKNVSPEQYHKILVIDATTGQNGLAQATLFNEAVSLDAIILTKYDSAAKGGALVQIGKQLNLPVLFVCTGEGYDDIHPFDKEEYLNSLLGL